MNRTYAADLRAAGAFDAVIFDLDGVITNTAVVHAAAWKRLFDAYLADRAARDDRPQTPFDADADYRRYVDGRPRFDGIRTFLQSRGISLPEGHPDDGPEAETVRGLGARKNGYYTDMLSEAPSLAYTASVGFVTAARERGMRTAVVSSSKNCAAVLAAAGIAELFEVKVDGIDLETLGLPGKPSPGLYLEAVKRLGVAPRRAVVVEDALVGVEAGRNGDFGLVVGVDRTGHRAELAAAGADVVVASLGEAGLRDAVFGTVEGEQELPSALERCAEIARRGEGKRVAVFLDYDGTLTPIVARPDLAQLDVDMRVAIRALARHCVVAVVSGRALADIRALVGIESLYYAGSHGFDIIGPTGWTRHHQEGLEFRALIDEAVRGLHARLDGINGVLIEHKTFTTAIHYRLVAAEDLDAVRAAIDAEHALHPQLRKTHGKKVYELQPALDWDKGKAVLWLLSVLGLDGADVLPLYFGDDETDEDAFRAVKDRGIGIAVQDEPRPTDAAFSLRDPGEVKACLEALARMLEGGAQ